MAEHERRMISARTKAGLERAKARGVKLGLNGAVLGRQNAAEARGRSEELRLVIQEIRETGKTTVRAIAGELNRRAIATLRGRPWHPHTVNVLLHRLDGKA